MQASLRRKYTCALCVLFHLSGRRISGQVVSPTGEDSLEIPILSCLLTHVHASTREGEMSPFSGVACKYLFVISNSHGLSLLSLLCVA